MKTIPKVTKEYVVSFDVRIDSIEKETSYSNIIHFTTGENTGPIGTPIPGVWLNNERAELLVHSAVNKTDFRFESVGLKVLPKGKLFLII